MSQIPKTSIDGLIKIAEANGMMMIHTRNTEGMSDDEAVCTCHLIWYELPDEEFRISRREARELGHVNSPVWDSYPAKMLRHLAMSLAIGKHFEKYGIPETLEAEDSCV